MQHGERVCKRVGGRDDTEIIGRKEFFGAGGAKRGKHKEKFLSSKGIEVWIVPSTDFLHHRRALSTFPQCTSRMRNEEEKGGVLWKSASRQSASTVQNRNRDHRGAS
ncbi:hypothetical protein ES20_00090 [Rothia aeria]|nr:hypothetical protein ES20_00090 [Rothia aeria]KGJ35180.1 hypothetical protein ES18_02045 [Rothia aeria]